MRDSPTETQESEHQSGKTWLSVKKIQVQVYKAPSKNLHRVKSMTCSRGMLEFCQMDDPEKKGSKLRRRTSMTTPEENNVTHPEAEDEGQDPGRGRR